MAQNNVTPPQAAPKMGMSHSAPITGSRMAHVEANRARPLAQMPKGPTQGSRLAHVEAKRAPKARGR